MFCILQGQGKCVETDNAIYSDRWVLNAGLHWGKIPKYLCTVFIPYTVNIFHLQRMFCRKIHHIFQKQSQNKASCRDAGIFCRILSKVQKFIWKLVYLFTVAQLQYRFRNIRLRQNLQIMSKYSTVILKIIKAIIQKDDKDGPKWILFDKIPPYRKRFSSPDRTSSVHLSELVLSIQ